MISLRTLQRGVAAAAARPASSPPAAAAAALLHLQRSTQSYSTHVKEVTFSSASSSASSVSSSSVHNDTTRVSQAAPNASRTNETPTSLLGAYDGYELETVAEAEVQRGMQAPNRAGVWSRSQRARGEGMVGPRFEQMWMKDQPQPYSAMELIHKQPVRWRKEKIVSCDGGGGPLGHPRIFINLDKPQINECTYCGLPFAKEEHRAHISAQPNPPYPLEPTGQVGEVGESQRITSEPLGQR